MTQRGPGRAATPGRSFHRWHHRAHRRSRARADGHPLVAPPAVSVDTVGLGRLLGLARLTPAQAVTVGTDVLAALVAGPDRTDGTEEHTAARRAHLDTVVIGPDGRARLRPAAGLEPTDVPEILDVLATAAGDAPRGGPHEAAALQRAAAALRGPDPAIAPVAAELGEAVAEPGAARAELARLVAAVHGRDGDAPAPVVARGPAPPVPPRPSLRDLGRRTVARTWKGVLVLLVLATLVVVEVVLLNDRIARDIDLVLDAGRSAPGPAASAPTEPTAPDAPPPPEPAAAAPITAVDTRSIGRCEPGGTCRLRVVVLLDPAPQPRTVQWFFRVVDRCSGATATVPGGVVDLPPDATRADAVQTVGLPAGEAPAVTAVTIQPAVAASHPLPVPATASCGPVVPAPSEGG